MAIKLKTDGKELKIRGAQDMPPMAASLGLMTWNKTGTWRNLRPVIDYEKCIYCGICWKFCPEPAIKIIDDKPVIDYDFCKGCMMCAEECPTDAILTEEEGK
jgi:2-oxoacid:acceptor oxidoreductase delta subunit (pyruvate/2-ketoisovalerate family)